MEPGLEKKKEPREITYQVGWKKGRIAWDNQVHSQDHAAAGGAAARLAAEEALHRRRLRRLWRAVPALPEAALLPLLVAVPVLLFVLTLLLVYGLRSV